MKYPLMIAGLSALLASAPALADNADVDSALKSRPELSQFTQALINTGVIHDLKPDESYTVFAPTNEAMAKITQQKYPCFYSADCASEVVQILRNHIVQGIVHIDEAAAQKGGLYPLSQRFIPIGKLGINDYAVDGNYVLSSSHPPGVMIYETDGMIATPRELMSVEYSDTTPQEEVTTHSKTIPDPACNPGGCSDKSVRTTTYTHTIYTP